ncbi:MAG: sulfite exporter TauE/SafE family protein [Pseudomonadota bacterium]
MVLEPWQLVLLSGVGVVAGWMNVMAGGGSLLTIPAMLFMGMPGPVANGTNRIAILAQNIVASLTFFRSGIGNLSLSLTLAAAASIGAAAGASAGVRLEGEWFNRVLAVVMIGVMVLMYRGGVRKTTETIELTPARWWAGHLCMVGAGAWGGFIQIGVGFILMPILHRVLGLDLVTTNAHKVLIVLIYTLVALTVFATQVELVWVAGLALAVGNAIGGWLGARTTISRGDRWIRLVFNLALTALVIKLLFF